MDLRAIKVTLAGMLGGLLEIDPLTGVPYVAPPAKVGAKTKAFAQAPMSLAEIDLPLWIIFTGPGSYPVPPDQTVDRLAHETRDFFLCLYVAVSQTGIDGEAERKVEPYLQPARDLIQKHPLMYDGDIAHHVPGVMRAYLVRDEGIIQLRYGDAPQTYDGLRFALRVEGLNEVQYGNE